ncbi:hypothetical protein [Actinomadura sp. KC216]|uniref:hypothetical protein n=1 Tax=Actinomadura sp. KC216 TaxID=2530370 RepID=UPI001A9D0FC4|nr:hypothetical protein [Actinomadura sp. KC216]
MRPHSDASPEVEHEAGRLRQSLADVLAEDGLLSDPAWRHVVETVPRHRFVPGFYTDSGTRSEDGLTVWEPVTASTDPDRWLREVYRDQTLITQFDGDEPNWNRPGPRVGGAPTSSSTLASLVLRM